ncbi:hypothetical protein MmiAt1_07630 [Methanimicrococcus sp. At1]|uniref:Uncharacterized protein n=1 Tax=Methanimicrococcus hacksteinii TaxID=3028293 RepID=A0ABU3VPX4_9EURY|nr:hypothetical protein [Methanimicrococcus sp. At1]
MVLTWPNRNSLCRLKKVHKILKETILNKGRYLICLSLELFFPIVFLFQFPMNRFIFRFNPGKIRVISAPIVPLTLPEFFLRTSVKS